MQAAAYNLLSSAGNAAVLQHTLRFIDYLATHEISRGQFDELQRHFAVLQKSVESDKFQELEARYTVLCEKLAQGDKIKFRWFDSLLVQAVEKGHWLVLDNANLCSPSVLDRLNSLLEMDGSLVINECTDADGNPRHLRPHPDFRLFLTADPRYGELSRAMRNRGIEIYLEQIEQRATSFDRRLLARESVSAHVSSGAAYVVAHADICAGCKCGQIAKLQAHLRRSRTNCGPARVLQLATAPCANFRSVRGCADQQASQSRRCRPAAPAAAQQLHSEQFGPATAAARLAGNGLLLPRRGHALCGSAVPEKATRARRKRQGHRTHVP
ncbi:hypothetical protein KL945_003749 [Ogataea haglerorum]|nr:hypothetical protein KL945_003749 [Ogataea haglerorum]